MTRPNWLRTEPSGFGVKLKQWLGSTSSLTKPIGLGSSSRELRSNTPYGDTFTPKGESDIVALSVTYAVGMQRIWEFGPSRGRLC